MLAKCANPACSTKFLRLTDGKLFQVETEFVLKPNTRNGNNVGKTIPRRRTEHFWLCSECAPFVTLAFDRKEGIVTVPLPHGKAMKRVLVVDPAFRPISGSSRNPIDPEKTGN
jgi:hypothetical protein